MCLQRAKRIFIRLWNSRTGAAISCSASPCIKSSTPLMTPSSCSLLINFGHSASPPLATESRINAFTRCRAFAHKAWSAEANLSTRQSRKLGWTCKSGTKALNPNSSSEGCCSLRGSKGRDTTRTRRSNALRRTLITGRLTTTWTAYLEHTKTLRICFPKDFLKIDFLTRSITSELKWFQPRSISSRRVKLPSA